MRRNLYIGILVTVTIVFVLAGTFINVGKNLPVLSFFSKDAKSISKDYSDVTGDFTAIDLEIDLGDITIESGSRLKISYTGLKKLAPEVSISDGLLKITQKGDSKLNINPVKIRAKLSITVPSETALTSLKAHLDLGDLKINGVKADDMVVSESLGDVKISECTFKNADITNNLGDIKMDLNGSIKDYGMDLDIDLGDVKLNGKTKGRSYSQVGDIMIKAHNDLGDIKISE